MIYVQIIVVWFHWFFHMLLKILNLLINLFYAPFPDRFWFIVDAYCVDVHERKFTTY